MRSSFKHRQSRFKHAPLASPDDSAATFGNFGQMYPDTNAKAPPMCGHGIWKRIQSPKGRRSIRLDDMLHEEQLITPTYTSTYKAIDEGFNSPETESNSVSSSGNISGDSSSTTSSERQTVVQFDPSGHDQIEVCELNSGNIYSEMMVSPSPSAQEQGATNVPSPESNDDDDDDSDDSSIGGMSDDMKLISPPLGRALSSPRGLLSPRNMNEASSNAKSSGDLWNALTSSKSTVKDTLSESKAVTSPKAIVKDAPFQSSSHQNAMNPIGSPRATAKNASSPFTAELDTSNPVASPKAQSQDTSNQFSAPSDTPHIITSPRATHRGDASNQFSTQPNASNPVTSPRAKSSDTSSENFPATRAEASTTKSVPSPRESPSSSSQQRPLPIKSSTTWALSLPVVQENPAEGAEGSVAEATTDASKDGTDKKSKDSRKQKVDKKLLLEKEKKLSEKETMLQAMRDLVIKQQAALHELAGQNKAYRRGLDEYKVKFHSFELAQQSQESELENLKQDKVALEAKVSWHETQAKEYLSASYSSGDRDGSRVRSTESATREPGPYGSRIGLSESAGREPIEVESRLRSRSRESPRTPTHESRPYGIQPVSSNLSDGNISNISYPEDDVLDGKLSKIRSKDLSVEESLVTEPGKEPTDEDLRVLRKFQEVKRSIMTNNSNGSLFEGLDDDTAATSDSRRPELKGLRVFEKQEKLLGEIEDYYGSGLEEAEEEDPLGFLCDPILDHRDEHCGNEARDFERSAREEYRSGYRSPRAIGSDRGRREQRRSLYASPRAREASAKAREELALYKKRLEFVQQRRERKYASRSGGQATPDKPQGASVRFRL